MAKAKEVKMWALWNFNTLFATRSTRKRAREYAYELHDKATADRMFRTGAFRIGKVVVTEARK